MKIISFMNYKGGVGKTTITSNVACELAFRGYKVLAIDLDPQTNLTLSFVDIDEYEKLVDNNKTIKAWYDVFIDDNQDMSLQDLIIKPNKANNKIVDFGGKGSVDLISSHLELINVDMELATMFGGANDRTFRSSFLRLFSRLKKGIEGLTADYDYVLIDCPPNFNIVTQNAIIASDYYLVPTKADYLSTMGIDQLYRHVNSLREKYNNFVNKHNSQNVKNKNSVFYHEISTEMLGVVFTMLTIYSGEPIKRQKMYIERVRNLNPVFDAYTRVNNTLNAEAPESGLPITLMGNLNEQYEPIRKELEQITDEIINKA
ncbi:ParA family protein [Enterococcus plantarum]|uniref:ParA family protein n=1 Tax=Enterococcus plantarum TaxID=1077675 RepID=UPI001A8C269D|nr:AAA family ATPase [Enterococcus plantarum]MBO0424161.1 ParA family protein [Enterococcus plantarum]